MIDVANFQPTDAIIGEDGEDCTQLKAMFQDARLYIEAFSWSPPIEQSYLAFGVGGVFALFLFVFERAIAGTDKELWVVTGDLPIAYFVTDEAQTITDAIDTYCNLMEDWIGAVEEGNHQIEVFPLAAARTKANAEALKTRITFVRENIL